MITYLYDPTTLIYLEKIDVQPDPIDGGIYPPSNSTNKEPLDCSCQWNPIKKEWEPMVDLLRSIGIEEAKNLCNNMRRALTGNPTKETLSGWNLKATLAQGVDSISSKAISNEASLRGKGESEEELRELIIKKHTAYALLVSSIDGLESWSIGKIESTLTQSDMDTLLSELSDKLNKLGG